MTHQTRDAAKRGAQQKQFVPKQPNENFKNVDNEQLERWVNFMGTELYKQIDAIFRANQASHLTRMANPAALIKLEETGRGIQFWQGAYQEDLLFSQFFESVKNEFDRRNAAKHEHAAS